MKHAGLKWLKVSLLMTVVLASAVPGLAQAQHRGHRGGSIGFYFGAPGPFFYPPAYYPPSYYPYHYAYPPVVIQQAAPPVYIEQGTPEAAPAPATPAAQAGNYWYYCNNPQGYYPYVQQCPQPWQKVSPVPAGQQ